jgi:hypothetical protein
VIFSILIGIVNKFCPIGNGPVEKRILSLSLFEQETADQLLAEGSFFLLVNQVYSR